MWRIPLLFTLTSRVCGTFVVTVGQSSYQAEENQNISLDWTFTRPDPFRISLLYILCEKIPDQRVLYRLFEGDEVPQSEDKQFSGRVQSDRDVLREGRLRLHVSRLRTEDSGLYECDVITDQGGGSDRCNLTVSAAVGRPEPQKDEPSEGPEPEGPEPGLDRGRIGLLVGLGSVAAVAVIVAIIVFLVKQQSSKRPPVSPSSDIYNSAEVDPDPEVCLSRSSLLSSS
ncbi:uncharacterized protein LOC115058581 isoform X1 [Echeneis naucrates]|uniref:uncharacterized protein LOC115058581 isoform X1 n=1 Tax=Echeneis naucrates TaxID=173247 RepID=UPI001113AC25|nr:uncharacterized protein LOC115058581 isoform X1 [Echeneis naucrates]